MQFSARHCTVTVPLHFIDLLRLTARNFNNNAKEVSP